MSEELTDNEILADMRYQLEQLKFPEMREPRTASYYKQMLEEAVERTNAMKPDAPEGRVKEYTVIPPKRVKRVPRKGWAWAYKLYVWALGSPEEVHLFLYGFAIGATLAAIIAVAIVL